MHSWGLRLIALAAIASMLSFPLSAAGRRRIAGPVFEESNAVPLAGYDPATSNEDLEALRQTIGDAHVVALGESFHTSGGFYLMKHRILRFLVEEMGFRAFAIESNWQGAEKTDQYVQTCAGTARDAIAQDHNVWQSSEYAGMVQWMCEWNRTHSAPQDKLTFFGFDIQQPWFDGEALVSFLSRHGLPATDPRSNGLRSCEAAFGLTHPFGEIPADVNATCLGSLDAIQEYLETNRARIVGETSEELFATAMLRVTGLRGWQQSVFIIKHDFAAGYNARDVVMAEAFHVRRAMKAPDAKTVVWAANSHIAQNPLPRGERPFGSYLKATLGDDYVNFALTAYEAEIDFPPYPCGLVEREPGSVEERLFAFGYDALLATPTAQAPRNAAVPMGLDLVRPFSDYDGIIYLRHSPKMHPYVWESCR